MATDGMSLSKELVFLILQFCKEEDLNMTSHILERETGIFFDLKYFGGLVVGGDWDEAEKYLSGFMAVEDDKFSTKIYFEIRKQKYLEALDDSNGAKALEILAKDLKVFASSNQELYDEMTRLLTLENFRSHSLLSSYGDAVSARKVLMTVLKALIEASPLLRNRLKFPEINTSRLRRLINQSLNWQHSLCRNPRPEPDISTIFEDHTCSLPDHPSTQSINKEMLPSNAIPASVSPLYFQQTSNLLAINEPVTLDGAMNISPPTNPGNATVGRINDNSDGVLKSSRSSSMVGRLGTALPQSQSFPFNIAYEFPMTVGRIFNLGSSPTSMDFHPVEQTILLVGTNVGDIELREVISGRKLLTRKFGVWNMDAKAMSFLANLVKEPHISVNRTLWSTDGSFFGIAFSKQIVQLYSYRSASSFHKQIEIDAHVGGVNDLAFSKPYEKQLIITCGDDKLIKVWDVMTGAIQYTFDGHGGPLYSLCAHAKEGISFLFSASTNGEINAWLFDNEGPRISHETPARCCVRMAYTADSKRLFSCGTNKNGESRIVEWNESEGSVMRSYLGLRKCSSGGVVKFDISKSKFLAAGDEHLIKVWHIDNIRVLTAIDADGDLPETPNICFNTEGTFLAVCANQNRIKILASNDGLQLLKTPTPSVNDFRAVAETSEKLAIPQMPTATVPTNEGFVVTSNSGQNENVDDTDDSDDTDDTDDTDDEEPESPAIIDEETEMQACSVIDAPSQCKSSRLPSCEGTTKEKISRLTYVNTGKAIIAFAESGLHLLWKWSKDEFSSNSKPITSDPQDRSHTASSSTSTDERAMTCFALSKNDCYVASASGGAISLFSTTTFKRMRTVLSPPPTATCLAFFPEDNNVLAIGMDDSTVVIFGFRMNKIEKKLQGHDKSISGLAFSTVLNVLVSSGQDNQVFVWDTNGWEKKKSRVLYMPTPQMISSPIHIQFHTDQTQFLVVHNTHVAVYEATSLECINKWVAEPCHGWISHATFSSDSQLVYASLQDGRVLIFTASNFHLRCQINPSAYLPSDISPNVYPLVVAAHPQERNQFAMGLSDGTVLVIEPPESDGKWDV